MRELVDKIESLAHDIWTTDEPEPARQIGASHFCQCIGEVGVAIDRARGEAEIRYRAALEAFWTDQARHFAEVSPQGEGTMRAIDKNMAIVSAAVRIRAQRGEFLRLLNLFAMEFVKLAIAFYEPCLNGGDVVFECRDFLTAKKRAEAMKRLAGAIEDLSRSDCGVDDVHGAIIAYCNGLGREGLKG